MVLDIRTQPNNSNKWKCPKCNTLNQPQVTRCSWCSAQMPKEGEPSGGNNKNARITQLLHQSIEKMSYPQKVKAWKWLEDNII